MYDNTTVRSLATALYRIHREARAQAAVAAAGSAGGAGADGTESAASSGTMVAGHIKSDDNDEREASAALFVAEAAARFRDGQLDEAERLALRAAAALGLSEESLRRQGEASSIGDFAPTDVVPVATHAAAEQALVLAQLVAVWSRLGRRSEAVAACR